MGDAVLLVCFDQLRVLEVEYDTWILVQTPHAFRVTSPFAWFGGPISYQDVVDLLAERGITRDRSTAFREVQKSVPAFRNSVGAHSFASPKRAMMKAVLEYLFQPQPPPRIRKGCTSAAFAAVS